MAFCFLNDKRLCQPDCLAYTDGPTIPGAKPSCAVVDAAVSIDLFLRKKNTAEVTHPTSAPPPEVL